MKKICTGCKRNRRIGKFAKDLSRKDRKRIYCRDCISIINRRYRLSPIGRIRHRKSVDAWKKKNQSAISEYNKAYYKKKRHIILYNKRSREATESVLILDQLDNMRFSFPKLIKKEIVIEINPKRKLNANDL